MRKEWWRKVTDGGSREEMRGRVRGYYWKREIRSLVGNKKHGGGVVDTDMHTCTQLHTRLHAEIRRREAASPVQSWHIPHPVQ